MNYYKYDSNEKNLNSKMKFYEPEIDRLLILPRIKNHEYGYNTYDRNYSSLVSSKLEKPENIYSQDIATDSLLKFFDKNNDQENNSSTIYLEPEYDEREIYKSSSRKKFFNSSYRPLGSKQSGGFGNLDNFSNNKFGEDSRKDFDTIRGFSLDDINDDNGYVLNHYQTILKPRQTSMFALNSYPEDSRKDNKKYY